MYKGVKKAKLGRKASNRKALMQNQIRSLFESGHVVTTSPKAKVLKSNAQSLIALGKKNKGMLSLRRELAVVLKEDGLVKKFVEYVEKDIAGVRSVKIGFRAGDNGEKSRVELIGMEKKVRRVVKKASESEKKEEVKIEKTAPKAKTTKNILGKGIDKSATVKKTGRATSRSGL
jgi:large subunit ribosomal protein L17